MAEQNVWAQRRNALKQAHVTCATAQDEQIRELAEPIQALLDKIDEVQRLPPDKQLALVIECDRMMFFVQGMGVHAYLESLSALRDVIADKVAKAPAGPVKQKLQVALDAHEQAIQAIGGAYEALRSGDKAAFEKAQAKLFALQPKLEQMQEQV